MDKQMLHILVADDDYPYSILLKKTLTGRGHSVSVSNSGESAISLLQKEIFDVVLLDFKMEGTNGINVLQWMYGKKMETPVILITGHGTEDIHDEAFKWGAVEYFIKGEMDPVRLPVLVEQVHGKFKAGKNKLS
jgi:DNA-binding NtrC family response regulator